MMRIVFFGATDLGHRCCRHLIEAGEEVVGIFSIKEHFRISYSSTPVRNVTFRSFEDLADRAGVPLIYVDGNMSDARYADALRQLQPDFGLAIGWYYLLPRALREMFPRGVAGIHASLLPHYRGGAPLVWSIINGEDKTGVSLFYLDDGVDDGDVIAQEDVPIGADDDINVVYDRATEASLALVRRYVPRIRSGVAPRHPQDHRQASVVPQRSPEDGLIRWDLMSARQVHDWVRAQTRPYPGAFTSFGGKRLTVWRSARTAVSAPADVETGMFVVNDTSLMVCCADRLLVELREIGEGDVAMTGLEFVQRRGVRTGQACDRQASARPAHGS